MRVTDLRRVGDAFEVRTADAAYRPGRWWWPPAVPGPLPPPAGGFDPSVTQVHSADCRNPQALPTARRWWSGGELGLQIAELAATRTVDLSIATRYPMLPQRLAAGPVLVADPAGPAAGHGPPGRPADEPPGLRDRDQPEAAGAGRGAVPAAAGRCRGPDGPLRRPQPPGGRRDGGVGDRLSAPTTPGSTFPGWSMKGHVVHRRGVTEVPGLYFLGLSWQHTRGRPCWASSTTTPRIWPTASPPAWAPPGRPGRRSPRQPSR